MYVLTLNALLLFSISYKFVDCNPFFAVGENVNFEEEIPESGGESMSMYRLPDNVIPLTYSLQISANLSGNFDFSGKVSISIKILKSTKVVYLHSKGLKIISAQISKPPFRKYDPEISLQPANETLKLETEAELIHNNEYNVEIEYKGTLKDDMIGFYRSSYTVENTTKWLATTQFEPTYARRAFPCFDEPGFKAIFSLIIGRHQHEKAISNMPLAWTSANNSTSKEDRVWDHFQPTPPMPTYLVAFVICTFNSVSESSKSVSVWSRENAIDNTKYALSISQQLIKEMESFTGVKYILPKLDLVAIPDFRAGAMENWGLTTYRERFILYNPKLVPEKGKEIIASVVAHEISHQWFGDYVTPTWWHYVWLNEAFATYFQYHIVEMLDETWRMKELFVVDALQTALFVDEADYYHAMTSPVKTPEEIKSVFDHIIYDKGGSILRMLEHIVTTKTFKKALNVYLDKGYKKGGSVVPDNLWDAFDEQIYRDNVILPTHTNIVIIMKGWTENRGYPLITVKRVRNGNLMNITIEQEPYKSPRATQATPNSDWIVPVTFSSRSSADYKNTEPKKWLFPHKTLILKDLVKPDEWFLCNIKQTGYYRVNYDQKGWSLIRKALFQNRWMLHPLNRAQLIDDAFSLAIDHKLSFDVPFRLLSQYNTEEDPIPILSAVKILHYVHSQYFSSVSNPLYLNRVAIDFIKSQYDRLGFNTKVNDVHLIKTLRPTIVRFACSLNITDCLNRVRNEYMKNIHSISNIQSDIKGVVLCVMLNTNSQTTVWNKMWELYKTSNMPYEKETVLMSAGCPRNRTLLKMYLNKLFDNNDKDIRAQYEIYVHRAVLESENGVTAGLEFLVNISSRISNMSQEHLTKVKGIVSSISSKVKTQEQMKLIDKLIQNLKTDKKLESLISALKKAKESAEKRTSYHKKTADDISNSLKNLFESLPTEEPGNTTMRPTSKPSSGAVISPTTFLIHLASFGIPVFFYLRSCLSQLAF